MKKYRTKSGKVEEKLPGINATVSPSEKVQIAMAGGANTLSDVQTILGQQGKRNNLKGQGAKHLVSYQADPGQDDESDEAVGNAPDDDGTSNTGGLDVSGGIGESVMSATPSPSGGMDDAGRGVSWGAPQPDVEGYDLAGPTPTATERAAATEAIGAKVSARARTIAQQEEDEENKQSLPSKALQYSKENPEEVAIGGFLLNVGAFGATVATAGLSAVVGYGISKAMNQPKTTEDTAAMEDLTPYGSTVQTAAMEDIGSIPTPPTPTATPDEGGDDAPKKKKKKPISYTDNKVTLDVNDKRSTRDIMRSRGGWRYA